MSESSSGGSGLELDRIAFYGRTAEEYRQFFGLEAENLATTKILDCAAGSSSFTAEMGAKGCDVTACDPFYRRTPQALYEKGDLDITYMVGQMKKVEDQFDWSFYGDLPRREAFARRSLAAFAEDAARRPSRYVAAALPELPFADGAFDIALSAHFLFVYGDFLTVDFHVAAIAELVRVARREAMIYPLVKAAGKPYPDMDEVRRRLDQRGVETKLQPTGWAFVKGAGHRLIAGRK